ncbi:MAG: enoyl-CoA hydratase/isomerase family protein [Acidobacteriota bacterium]
MTRFASARFGGRLAITFDDGGMNLLSSDALVEFQTAIESARDAQLVTFASARPGLFAAGADMAEMIGFTAADAGDFARRGQELFASIEALAPVTVALIDGDCFGGALDMAMAFDLRFATARSRFSHPGARIGIVTGFGGTSRWRKLLDRAAARELFLGGGVLSASESLESGLVDRVAASFDAELERLTTLDRRTTRFLKEMAPRAGRLGPNELDLLGARLWELYGFCPSDE